MVQERAEILIISFQVKIIGQYISADIEVNESTVFIIDRIGCTIEVGSNAEAEFESEAVVIIDLQQVNARVMRIDVESGQVG